MTGLAMSRMGLSGLVGEGFRGGGVVVVAGNVQVGIVIVGVVARNGTVSGERIAGELEGIVPVGFRGSSHVSVVAKKVLLGLVIGQRFETKFMLAVPFFVEAVGIGLWKKRIAVQVAGPVAPRLKGVDLVLAVETIGGRCFTRGTGKVLPCFSEEVEVGMAGRNFEARVVDVGRRRRESISSGLHA